MANERLTLTSNSHEGRGGKRGEGQESGGKRIIRNEEGMMGRY
jgi:hypothetical protein